MFNFEVAKLLGGVLYLLIILWTNYAHQRVICLQSKVPRNKMNARSPLTVAGSLGVRKYHSQGAKKVSCTGKL